MRTRVVVWLPAVVLALGAIFTVGLPGQRRMPLRAPLAESIPENIAGYQGYDLSLSEGERKAAGVTDYLLRTYEAADSAAVVPWFSVYVGYYDSQSQGKTIHTPKNCLPGSGWEPLSSGEVLVATGQEAVRVNRYILQRDSAQVAVLYWYQGRGRVEASEYRVKWDLLRDAVLARRSDEALVRIIVPLAEGRYAASEAAASAAATVVRALDGALPG